MSYSFLYNTIHWHFSSCTIASVNAKYHLIFSYVFHMENFIVISLCSVLIIKVLSELFICSGAYNYLMCVCVCYRAWWTCMWIMDDKNAINILGCLYNNCSQIVDTKWSTPMLSFCYRKRLNFHVSKISWINEERDIS